MSTAPSKGSELRIGECGIASPQATKVAVIIIKGKIGMSFFIGVLRNRPYQRAGQTFRNASGLLSVKRVKGDKSVSIAFGLQLSQFSRELF